jgi:predicted nucleic acid-binding protein
MIVVDSNTVVYAFTPGPFAREVELLAEADPFWVTVELCRSEFRNVMAAYLRKSLLTLEQVNWIIAQKETHFEFAYYEVNSLEVMSLVAASRCSSYDCEYVALAKKMGVPLITYDEQILNSFPEIAYNPVRYLASVKE